MAQHPFAAQARKVMEENGIVFNADGSTSVRVAPPTQEDKTTTGVVDDNKQTAETHQDDTAAPETAEAKVTEEKPVSELDKLIQMQREELEQLRKQVADKSVESKAEAKSQRETELERELAELREQISAQTRKEQADEFRAMLERQGFDSEVVDDAVLLEIRDSFIKPVAHKVEALEQRLSQQEEKLRAPTEAERIEEVKRTTQAGIVAEIPDFMTIFNSKGFQEKLAAKDPRFPTKTYGHALQVAYENGDKDFIVREVKAFMNGGTAPKLADVADVGATKGVGGKADKTETSKSKYTFSPEEAVQMLRKRQVGQLTQKEYSEYRAKLDASRSKSSN